MKVAFSRFGRSVFWFREWFQGKPDERQRSHAERDSGEMIAGVLQLYRFIAEIVRAGAADRSDKVLPQMIARNTLGSLQKKHDQTGKDQNCQPIVRCFHDVFPNLCSASTTVPGAAATPLRMIAARAGVSGQKSAFAVAGQRQRHASPVAPR